MSKHSVTRPESTTFYMPSNRTWPEYAEKNYGIQLIQHAHEIPDQLDGDNVLWTSRCSKTKTDKQTAIPKDFYIGSINLAFYERMELHGLRYGIISDFYGLVMDNETIDSYDLHPTALSAEEKKQLGAVIREKTLAQGYDELVFYNSSPLMSRPYFEMLYWSGLPIYFISKLDILDEYYGVKPRRPAKRTAMGRSLIKAQTVQTSLF